MEENIHRELETIMYKENRMNDKVFYKNTNDITLNE